MAFPFADWLLPGRSIDLSAPTRTAAEKPLRDGVQYECTILLLVVAMRIMSPRASIPSNPATGRAWTRNELIAELEVERKKNSCRINGIVTWSEQLSNAKGRWKIHLKEWGILNRQVYELGRECRTFAENQLLLITAAVSLPRNLRGDHEQFRTSDLCNQE
ncbi:MAG: hypothetical protein AB8B32_08775 [Prochlorococcus sp.]